MGFLGFRKKDNDYETFEQLVESHLDGMYGVALRYTRDPSRAEDLVHDTVVKALRFRHRFEMGTNFKAWIYTILTRTFIHRYRRQKREREILDGYSRFDVDGQLYSEATRESSRAPEAVFMRNMLSDDVLAALDSLSEDFRAVVVLCDIEGLSYKEIAETLDCPVGTVMSRLFRGRRLLERMLEHLAIEKGIIRKSSEAEAEEDKAGVLDMNKYRRRKGA